MPAICPRCQTPLAPNELEGLCPRCLLAAAVPLERINATTTPPGGFVAPVPAQLAPLFPQLEVLELLGQGGMGAVYKARQVKLDRLVALKVLPPDVAAGPEFAERFTREARALARLNHPNIVAVYDFGEVEGLYYLVLEYVEGMNLRQAMAAGTLAPPQALALVGQLCAALQYAHDNGVVHRDVKPENVLLDRQGRVKVADFGLAKLVGPAAAPGRLTGTQQAMGTPHYMAPEQWERPLAVDHRADVYSLGVVFYELLTGELPLGKFAPPSARPGVDARLDGVVLRAIEKQPEQRYQHMSEMKSAVESVERPPAPAVATPSRLRLEVEVLVTLGMVVLVGGAWLALMLARPTFLLERFQRTIGAAFFIAFVLFVGAGSYNNRYLKRLWAIVVLSVPLMLLAGEVSGLAEVITGWHWFLALVFAFWAGSSLPETFQWEAAAASTPAAPTEPPLPGLTPREEALRQALLHADPETSLGYHVSVAPEIDSALLATARKSCKAPPEECVLGVLSFSDDEGEAGLLFGCEGLYWCNPAETSHPGTGSIRYDELAGLRLVNHGDAVYLGNDRYLCPFEEGTGITPAELTTLLYQVRDAWLRAS